MVVENSLHHNKILTLN